MFCIVYVFFWLVYSFRTINFCCCDDLHYVDNPNKSCKQAEPQRLGYIFYLRNIVQNIIYATVIVQLVIKDILFIHDFNGKSFFCFYYYHVFFFFFLLQKQNKNVLLQNMFVVVAWPSYPNRTKKKKENRKNNLVQGSCEKIIISFLY